ncbi:MAG: dienelactone hydrolase family protein [Pseudonocardia sp.]|nr:dienelactone hydrolase family protein [Pseudonocardia sp.]
MTRHDVTIVTTDGSAPATLHLPDGDGPWPGVLVYPDAGGARETFRVMGDKVAALGYVALVPDIYYRDGDWKPFDLATVFGDPEERTRLMGMVHGLTQELVIRDAGDYLSFLLGRPEVAGEAVGTTGYCRGGWTSLTVAASYPDKVAAAASFHGGGLAAADDPTSPHLLASNIKATVYVAGAENDDSFDQGQFDRLEEALSSAGVEHTLLYYPAAHGFAVPDNPTYDADAEKRHWDALENLYATALARR